MHPLPWYIAGPLIGLVVPALLLIGNKPFGVSSNFRHLCGAIAPCGIEFFRHDWKRLGAWNLAFLGGVFVGAAIAWRLAPVPAVDLSARTVADLQRLGLQFDADALLAQFAGINLELEHPEPDEQARVFHLDLGGLWGWGSHIDDTRRKCCQYTTVGLSH